MQLVPTSRDSRDGLVVQAFQPGSAVIGLDAQAREQWRSGILDMATGAQTVSTSGGGVVVWHASSSAAYRERVVPGELSVRSAPPEQPVAVRVVTEVQLVDPSRLGDYSITVGATTRAVRGNGPLELRLRAQGTLHLSCVDRPRARRNVDWPVPRLGGAFAWTCPFGFPGERTPAPVIEPGTGGCRTAADCHVESDCCGGGTSCTSIPPRLPNRCAGMGACQGPTSEELARRSTFLGCVCQAGTCASRVRPPSTSGWPGSLGQAWPGSPDPLKSGL
jgi:hypothetical protein